MHRDGDDDGNVDGIGDCYAPDVDVDDIDAADTRELKLILMIKWYTFVK